MTMCEPMEMSTYYRGENTHVNVPEPGIRKHGLVTRPYQTRMVGAEKLAPPRGKYVPLYKGNNFDGDWNYMDEMPHRRIKRDAPSRTHVHGSASIKRGDQKGNYNGERSYPLAA